MNIIKLNINFERNIVKVFFTMLMLILSISIQAQEDFSDDKNIPERPNPPKLVNDFAHMFKDYDAYLLEQKLVAYDDSTSTQIAVVTVETLNGYAEDDYALRLGRKWGIGQKGKNNGILVLISKEERAISIELGYGIESYITDTDAKRLIDNVMIPYFKQGEYFTGVDIATSDLIAMLQGTYQNDELNSNNGDFTTFIIIFIIILIFIIFISSKTNGGGGNYTGGSGGWTWTSGSGSGWSGGSSWGGSSGGGGFGGFGGGSFGGGGASGRW